MPLLVGGSGNPNAAMATGPAPAGRGRRVGEAHPVTVDDLEDLLAHGAQLGRRQVGHGVVGDLGVAPLLGVGRPGQLPLPPSFEEPLVEVVGQAAGGGRGGLVALELEAAAQPHPPPRPLATGAARRLLDEAELGQRAEVERRVGRRLVERLAGLGGGHRTVACEQLEQRDADRVGQRPHLLGVGELAPGWDLRTRFGVVERHVPIVAGRRGDVANARGRGEPLAPAYEQPPEVGAQRRSAYWLAVAGPASAVGGGVQVGDVLAGGGGDELGVHDVFLVSQLLFRGIRFERLVVNS